jgi:acetolactate synthase I/II/III large subunit
VSTLAIAPDRARDGKDSRVADPAEVQRTRADVRSDDLTGAQSLLATLLNCGVEACFANPGTSELHLVAALQNEARIRSVLCLFEGVATGAADGYGRMAGKPAATLLHLGPGLGNGWANLHNAKRARTPVLNVVGEHATWHKQHDVELSSDLEGLSASISDWTRVAKTAADIGKDTVDAYRAATAKHGQIATLILPADTSWDRGGVAAEPLRSERLNRIDGSDIDKAAAILTSGRRVAILTTGPALHGAGRDACTRIAAKTGARMFCKGLNARMERGAGRMPFTRLSGWGQVTLEVLSAFDDLIIVGAGIPVLSFAHPEWQSMLVPRNVEVLKLASAEDDVVGTFEALAAAVGAPARADTESLLERRVQHDLATGPLDAEAVGRAISRFLPEGAILSDESGTGGGGHYPFSANAVPHDSLFLAGGSIGQALPVALGAAVACPDRKVVCLQADGGGMYTLQALWSMARETCDVTAVIFSNRKYGILMRSMGQYGITGLPNRVPDLFDLSNPDIRWALLAAGMGVEGHACDTADDFNRVFEDCMRRKGPHLIEAVI